jgi:predicted enzyme related to lactoylglutathione lyase
MSISRIATVWLPVTDMDRSVAFFRDSLGLQVEQHEDEWSEVTAGDVTIGLNGRSEEQPGSGGGLIAFKVDGDIEAEVEELKGKGVEFDGEVTDHPWGRIATFHDPDGTELQLYAPPA